MLEWPKGAVLKTAVEMRCTAINLVGSNPTLSICVYSVYWVKSLVFCLIFQVEKDYLISELKIKVEMTEYTIDNAIIDVRDPELKEAIGKECYYGFSPYAIVRDANRDVDSGILVVVDPDKVNPFEVTTLSGKGSTLSVPCIIIKRNPVINAEQLEKR